MTNYRKELYKWRKENHICVRCGTRKARKGYTMCPDCAMDSIIKAEKYKSKHKEELAEKRKAKRNKRKAEGICVYCGKPALENMTHCEDCRQRFNKYSRSYYRRKQEASYD